MANVLLESLACGTPVVTTPAEGTEEIVTCTAAGLVVRDRRPESLAQAIRTVLTAPADRAPVRAHAETLGWTPTVTRLLGILQEVTAGESRSRWTKDIPG
jgi:glycosyltransferase involved in cell wall biosynthesis